MNTPSQKIRLTISVTPEVHAAFTRLSQAGGMSLGRAMGDWLEDTLEAVQFTAAKVEQARSAPRQVVMEMHAYALGLADETSQALSKMREKAAALRAESSVPPPSSPRPVIRGVKSSKKAQEQGGKSHD